MIQQIRKNRRKHILDSYADVRTAVYYTVLSLYTKEFDFKKGYGELLRITPNWKKFEDFKNHLDSFSALLDELGLSVSVFSDIIVTLKEDYNPFTVFPSFRRQLKEYLYEKLSKEPFAEIRLNGNKSDGFIVEYLEDLGFDLQNVEHPNGDIILVVKLPS